MIKKFGSRIHTRPRNIQKNGTCRSTIPFEMHGVLNANQIVLRVLKCVYCATSIILDHNKLVRGSTGRIHGKSCREPCCHSEGKGKSRHVSSMNQSCVVVKRILISDTSLGTSKQFKALMYEIVREPTLYVEVRMCRLSV